MFYKRSCQLLTAFELVHVYRSHVMLVQNSHFYSIIYFKGFRLILPTTHTKDGRKQKRIFPFTLTSPASINYICHYFGLILHNKLLPLMLPAISTLSLSKYNVHKSLFYTLTTCNVHRVRIFALSNTGSINSICGGYFK